MSQHDYAIADQAGLAFLADINAALAAAVSQNSGATEPADTFPYMFWADTTSGWLKQRNAADTGWEVRLPLACARDDVASASTLDLDAQTAHYLRITGTTTVTAVTLADGQMRTAVANAAFQLTHGASLLLPGAANYTTAAGDILRFHGEATGVVRVEIVPAGSMIPAVIAQATAEAGTDTTPRLWTAQRVAQAIAAQATSGLTSGTAVASTSGTAIDFTSIPSGTKRIKVMLNGVSTNGTSNIIVRLGDSGGVETSGYVGSNTSIVGTTSGSAALEASGFSIAYATAASSVWHGTLDLSLVDVSANLWEATGVFGRSDTAATSLIAGGKALSATLDRVRITTVNGTDAFDAGTINILYE